MSVDIYLYGLQLYLATPGFVVGPEIVVSSASYLDSCVILRHRISVGFASFFSNCDIFGILETTSGSGVLDGTVYTSSCWIEFEEDWEVAALNSTFQGGLISTQNSDAFTLSGTGITLDGVSVEILGSVVTVSGDNCALLGCVGASVLEDPPDFTVSVTAAANDTRLIGNSFSGAIVDLGFGTVNVGNTT